MLRTSKKTIGFNSTFETKRFVARDVGFHTRVAGCSQTARELGAGSWDCSQKAREPNGLSRLQPNCKFRCRYALHVPQPSSTRLSSVRFGQEPPDRAHDAFEPPDRAHEPPDRVRDFRDFGQPLLAGGGSVF